MNDSSFGKLLTLAGLPARHTGRQRRERREKRRVFEFLVAFVTELAGSHASPAASQPQESRHALQKCHKERGKN